MITAMWIAFAGFLIALISGGAAAVMYLMGP